MGIKQLYNENLRKLPNEYGDVSVMQNRPVDKVVRSEMLCARYWNGLGDPRLKKSCCFKFEI